MIASALGVMLLAAAGGPPAVPDLRVALAQLTIRERVIVRVPTRAVAAPRETKWKEKKGPRCVSMAGVAGAAVKGDHVDMLYRGGLRIRAELEDECPALDYYNGFYIAPTADRQICAGRDSIHARSGGECQIRRFRKLVPDD